MSLEDPVIITCSISGALANREQCPAIPYTPEEYAAEARRIVDEGGAMIHIHARRPDGTPSYEVEDFQAIADAILAEVDDVIVNFSTGALGVPIDKRVAYLRACRPDVAALNMGSMNYAKYSARRKEFVFQTVFANPFDEIIALLEAMNELGIKPEHECFDVGHVGSLAPLVDMGVLHPPLHVSCVMGVTGGIPPTARNLALMADNVPAGSHWGVIGISRAQWMLVAASLTLGGSVRVGLEDNFYLPDGTMARSNGELIAKARQLTEDVGRRPATRRRGARDPRRAAEGRGVTRLPLDGVRVLDLSRLLPGGFCSLMLADFGADVLKVEDTGLGDYVRWATPVLRGRRGLGEVGALPGAQSRQALDPAEPQDATRAARCCCALVRESDVVLESFRPGVLDRLGVGYEAMREVNPAIVYCAITGYGQDGPLRERSGPRHELPGLVGLLGLTGDAGGPPVQAAGQIADLGGGGADGGLRDPRRAARARPLGRGPARRRLDGRRRAVVAGAWWRRATWPRTSCRAAATSSSPGRWSATGPTRAPTGGSRSAPWSRSSGRPGVGASGARTSSSTSSRGRAARRIARSRPCSTRARARSGAPSPPSTTAAWSRCSSSTRRSSPSSCARARWWWSSTSRGRSGRCGCSASR